MKLFEVDIFKFVRLLLPTFLRPNVITAMVQSSVSPLSALLGKLNLYRVDSLYRLHITPQICYLQKMLNDRYDADLRRIYITDGAFRAAYYIYMELEQSDVFFYQDSELQDIPIYQSDEIGAVTIDFSVYVPNALTLSENELSVLLSIYKLTSKTFTINRF